MSFCENDYIEININILTQQGLIDFDSFKWLKSQQKKLPMKNFIDFKSYNLEEQGMSEFDTCRICELELLNTKWQSSSKPEYENILSKVKFLFEPTFIVQKMLWDDVGYDLFKFYLVAAQRGI